jgi:autotransporter-associated beta strand protein
MTGPVQVNAGLLAVSSDAAFGVVPGTFNAASIVLNGGGLMSSGSGTMVEVNANRGVLLNANASFGTSATPSQVFRVNSVVSESGGSFALVQNGPGTVVLAADNTYTGGTTIAAGTLQLGAGGSTGDDNGDDNGYSDPAGTATATAMARASAIATAVACISTTKAITGTKRTNCATIRSASASTKSSNCGCTYKITIATICHICSISTSKSTTSSTNCYN